MYDCRPFSWLPWTGVVLRKLFIAAALAAVAALPAGAAPVTPAQVVAQSLLMPDVSYQRAVEFTPHGPVVLDVVTAPRPDGSLYTLAPVLSNNAVVATEKLTDMEKDLASTATVVGVNGDFFVADPGKPSGILMRGGALDTAPTQLALEPRHRHRRHVDGCAGLVRRHLARDRPAPPVRPECRAGQGSYDALHIGLGAGDAGRSGVAVDVLSAIPALLPNRVATGVVSQVTTAGPVPIPPGGAVLVARGNQAPHLTTEAPAGTTIELRPTLTPSWNGMSAQSAAVRCSLRAASRSSVPTSPSGIPC